MLRQSPVFVHAWWRAASTWFWAKLRDRPGLRCYYEPLHERLSVLTLETLRRMRVNPEGLRSTGHPQIDRPYFAEFEPLLGAGPVGVPPEVSYGQYLLGPDASAVELERYLRRLLDDAAGAGKRPVLFFTRSQMRAEWMKRRLGGLHIVQLRNPRDQWSSFLGQGGDRSYFRGGTLLIAWCLAQQFPRAFSHLAGTPGPGEFRGLIPVKVRQGGLLGAGAPMGAERDFATFVLIWLASTLQSLSAADLVLDCDRLSEDDPARRRACAQLADWGLDVDLSDLATPRYREHALTAERLDWLEGLAVRQLAGDARTLAVLDIERAEAALDYVSDGSRPLLASALAALRSARSTTPSR